MPNKVKILDTSTLEEMHTGSLKRRLTELHRCEESFAESDKYGYQKEPNPKETGYIEFKDSPEWKEAHSTVKRILANREHIPNTETRKIDRKQRAKQNRSTEKGRSKEKMCNKTQQRTPAGGRL